jgi:hypothetical protein
MTLNDWDVSFDNGHIIALTRKIEQRYMVAIRRGYFTIYKYTPYLLKYLAKEKILEIYDKDFNDLPNSLALEISDPQKYGKKYLTILQKYSILVCNNDLLT